MVSERAVQPLALRVFQLQPSDAVDLFARPVSVLSQPSEEQPSQLASASNDHSKYGGWDRSIPPTNSNRVTSCGDGFYASDEPPFAACVLRTEHDTLLAKIPQG